MPVVRPLKRVEREARCGGTQLLNGRKARWREMARDARWAAPRRDDMGDPIGIRSVDGEWERGPV